MRQRKVKNLEERLAAFSKILIEDGKALKGNWKMAFGNENEIYMELGCGKGRFVIAQAQKNPDKNYIAVEGQETVILRALEKTEELNISNIRFMKCYINDAGEYFESELSGIYLNFSDPWPKDRHAKRRLTHRKYLEGYEKALEDSGFVEFKTDNDPLFDFSREEINIKAYEVLEYTRDLHDSDFAAKEITTEYEEKFKALDKNINYIKFVPRV